MNNWKRKYGQLKPKALAESSVRFRRPAQLLLGAKVGKTEKYKRQIKIEHYPLYPIARLFISTPQVLIYFTLPITLIPREEQDRRTLAAIFDISGRNILLRVPAHLCSQSARSMRAVEQMMRHKKKGGWRKTSYFRSDTEQANCHLYSSGAEHFFFLTRPFLGLIIFCTAFVECPDGPAERRYNELCGNPSIVILIFNC